MSQAISYVLTTPAECRRALRAVECCKADLHRPWEIRITRYAPHRSNPQNRTMWMWHAEVAAWLSQNTSKLWSANEVHNWIFKQAFCPADEIVMPDGNHRWVPRGSSRLSREEMSEALTAYQAWALNRGVELTEPLDG